MKTGLTFVQLVHNIKKIRYPWPMSFYSALPIAEKFVFVVAGPHDDNTENDVFCLAEEYPDTIAVIHGSSEKDAIEHRIIGHFQTHYFPDIVWPSHKEGLAELVQEGFQMAETEVVIQLQADEILDEADYTKYLAMPQAPDNIMAWRFGFRHLCHDFHHIFPFMYGAIDWGHPGVVRACRSWSDWVNTDDAVQMQGTGDVADLGNIVWHCGKIDVGREASASFKEMKFQELYPPPFPDPLVVKAYREGGLSYEDIFAKAYRDGIVREYNGPWPEQVRAYARFLGVEL